MLIISPPQLEKFFEEIGIPIEDKASFQPPQITSTVIENVIKTAAKYGLEFYCVLCVSYNFICHAVSFEASTGSGPIAKSPYIDGLLRPQ